MSKRHRVAFEQRAVTSDGYGGQRGAFEEQFLRWAEFIPRFGGEEVMEARLAGRQPVTMILRRDADTRLIETDWRVRDVASGDYYNIRSIVDPEDRRNDRDLLCEKGVAT